MLRNSPPNRIESKVMHKVTDKLVKVNPLEAAKAALPFFGGEEQKDDAADVSTGTVSEAEPTDAVDSGDSSSDEDLTKNPEAIADLLKQLSETSKQVK